LEFIPAAGWSVIFEMLVKFEYILKRLVMTALVLLGLSVITFTLARVVPSNPAALYIGPRARPEQIEAITTKLGLDKPLYAQYLYYLRDALRGDLQNSIATKRPVVQEITQRLPSTLELILAGMLLATTVGILLGVLSARFQGGPLDTLVRVVSLVGVSLPAFWLGLLLQIIFYRQLGWFPITGRLDTTLRFTHPIEEITGFYLVDSLVTGNMVAFKNALWHLVLPAITLAAYPMGLVARMTRATMLEVLSQDYIRTARAYGVGEKLITASDALKNALGPTLTVIGLSFAYALTGTFFVELVFNWPGLGTFTVHSLLKVDYPAIMGVTLFAALGYAIVNLIVDLTQAWIDPRISLE
jgi:ABC-type dipeptide/oligopeptide/nickel transport system permease component